MANINLLVKRKQYLWAGLICLLVALVVGAGLMVSGMKPRTGSSTDGQEPAPDLTGVVDTAFDEKVAQHAITQTQAEITRRFKALEQEMATLNKRRVEDQQRLETLSEDNARLTHQLKGLAQSSPSLVPPVAPEGEPAPSLFPPGGHAGQITPPTAFYPGAGTPPPPQVTYTPIPVPGQLNRQTFDYGRAKAQKTYPYIPSGSFAKSILIEGADANASVTGNQATVPMQVRLTGHVEMPNSKTYDLAGCFVSMEAYGDVSSERAIVRTRKISCIKGDDVIDLPIAGHVSFMGKNGVKGEVVMRNGKILGWAWGAGFVDGLGQGASRAAQPTVGLGATANMGMGDIAKSAFGGGASKAAQTLSDYYIKRAEQYHPVIPIGAGNEVTVVFHDGFQLKTIAQLEAEKSGKAAENTGPHLAGENLNGFNTDEMLKQLGQFDPRQFGADLSQKGVR